MIKRLSLVLGLTLLSQSAMAAVTANSLVTAQTPKAGKLQLANGSLGPTAVYTAGSNGSKCVSLYTTNSDTSSETLTIDRYNGSTAYVMLTISTVITAGFANAIPAQNLLSATVSPGLPVDGNNNPFFYLNSGDTLRATAGAITSGKFVNVFVECQDF